MTAAAGHRLGIEARAQGIAGTFGLGRAVVDFGRVRWSATCEPAVVGHEPSLACGQLVDGARRRRRVDCVRRPGGSSGRRRIVFATIGPVILIPGRDGQRTGCGGALERRAGPRPR